MGLGAGEGASFAAAKSLIGRYDADCLFDSVFVGVMRSSNVRDSSVAEHDQASRKGPLMGPQAIEASRVIVHSPLRGSGVGNERGHG